MSTRKSDGFLKIRYLRLIGTVGLVVSLLNPGALVTRTLRADLSPPKRVMPTEPAEDEESPEPEEITKSKRVPQTVGFSDAEEMETPMTGNSIGVFGRASHLAAKTFGRNVSITPIEAMPYLLTDEHFIFADVRGFVTNQSRAGGNFGLGYRRLIDEWNAWAGASVWYDADQSTGKMFQQVSLSFEGLIQQFEVRSNVYLPTSSSQSVSNSISNATIVGNQLLYSRSIDVGTALRGVDAEIGYSQPVLDRHVVRGFVGGYHFEGGSTSGVNGFKARVEGVINNTITAQVLYTHDKLYGDNFMVGLSLQFPFANNHPTASWTRNTPSPFRFVERNYNVIVAQSISSESNQVAADPTTGKAYVIDQIYANPNNPPEGAGTPDGTGANPFSSVSAAQLAGGNVFIVQSGSVLNQAITLNQGQYLFGQGHFSETLATTGGGNVQIPNLLLAASLQSGAGSTPIIQGVNGSAVTLASNSGVAGFNIVGASGNGISGNGVTGVSIHDLVFSAIGGDAINLTNSSGNVIMSNLQIISASGNGVVFNGGSPNITYLGAGNTITATGNGFVLENLTGGSIAIDHLSLTNNGGTGLLINSVASNATINSLSVTQSGAANSGGPAVSLSGLTGVTKTVNGVSTSTFNTYNFTGTTTINSSNGLGFAASGTDARINIANLNETSTSTQPAISLVNATSAITVGNLDLNTKNGMGLYAEKVNSLQINGGEIKTVNAPAIDIQSSEFNAKLSAVSVNGGPYGIQIDGSTGNFVIQGNGSAATGGTIQNTTVGGILINSYGNTNISYVDIVNNTLGIQSANTTSLSLSHMNITGMTQYAIDSLNDGTVSLSNSVLTGNGAVGGGTIRLRVDTVGTYASYIEANTISDSNGAAIQILSQSGGAGSPMSTQISGNVVTGYQSGSTIVGMNWNGAVVATVSGNAIYAYGANMTAISLQDSSLLPTTVTTSNTAGSNLLGTVSVNSIFFQNSAATSGTGIYISDGQSGQTSTGNSTLSVTSNGLKFQGTGGTGLRFGLYETTTATITGNNMADLAGGATGMLFDYAAASSYFTINSNTINLLADDTLTHRGIIFSQVAPTISLYAPSGSATNWIRNTASVSDGFSIPKGTAIGGVIIDNVLLTAP
jgi:Inverse autotransporter, beta-domain